MICSIETNMATCCTHLGRPHKNSSMHRTHQFTSAIYTFSSHMDNDLQPGANIQHNNKLRIALVRT